MRNPFLDAFKSLDEVDDVIVAKEKRIIKENLEESDYKIDEDALDVEFTPIENAFTASNLYEGLDDIEDIEPLVEDAKSDTFRKYTGLVYKREIEELMERGYTKEQAIASLVRDMMSDPDDIDGDLEAYKERLTREVTELVDEVSESLKEDKEELEEEILNEKLPKDLAKIYRRLDREGQHRVGFSGDDRRQSEVDYEKAEYKEITPEEAIQARKDGRIQDLRIIKDDQLISYREDGYPLMGIEWVDKEDRFINRNGKEIKDTRLMPPSHVFKIADKIYLTNERENRFPYGKWVDGEYVYDDPTQQARVQQQKDLVPDTGAHKKVDRDYKGNIRYSYGTPEYDEQQSKEYLKNIEQYEKQLSDLEDKWEEGDISKKDYEAKKANIEEYINRYKKYAEESKTSAIKRRGAVADAEANKRFALSAKELRKNIERYKELKRSIDHAQWDLDYLKRQGGLSSYSLKGGSYENKVKEIESLKARMAEIQKQIEKLESEATDELKQSNLDQNTKALNDAQKRVDDFQAELDSLLNRAHKSSGKEESLNEAMVDLKDMEQVEETREKIADKMFRPENVRKRRLMTSAS